MRKKTKRNRNESCVRKKSKQNEIEHIVSLMRLYKPEIQLKFSRFCCCFTVVQN